MSQNIYTEAWKKILRDASRKIDAQGTLKITYPASQITSLSDREASGHTMKFLAWGGKCINSRNSAVFRDLRTVYEDGSDFKNRFPGNLEIVLNANDEILISHQYLTYEDYIQRYREQQMPKNLADEKYKFRLVQSFQENWKLYETGKMSITTLIDGKQFGNLVYMGLVPTVFGQLAREQPAELARLLALLFDESLPLGERIPQYFTEFKVAYQTVVNPGPNTGQDERTIATLLTFRYPDKYTLYKYGFYAPLSKSSA